MLLQVSLNRDSQHHARSQFKSVFISSWPQPGSRIHRFNNLPKVSMRPRQYFNNRPSKLAKIGERRVQFQGKVLSNHRTSEHWDLYRFSVLQAGILLMGHFDSRLFGGRMSNRVRTSFRGQSLVLRVSFTLHQLCRWYILWGMGVWWASQLFNSVQGLHWCELLCKILIERRSLVLAAGLVELVLWPLCRGGHYCNRSQGNYFDVIRLRYRKCQDTWCKVSDWKLIYGNRDNRIFKRLWCDLLLCLLRWRPDDFILGLFSFSISSWCHLSCCILSHNSESLGRHFFCSNKNLISTRQKHWQRICFNWAIACCL